MGGRANTAVWLEARLQELPPLHKPTQTGVSKKHSTTGTFLSLECRVHSGLYCSLDTDMRACRGFLSYA